ncbi:hypothetical protein GH714_036953 [Hevea brasiliensis]|uniref:COI1 F-box domain-containing protein n=1 Tax=Hevea brasiliensis TaxID=3981 RepID=A0A6A6L9C6_HEVBR|nr:hypothetical protein GH714_036953 [Hevea brasiliensis]
MEEENQNSKSNRTNCSSSMSDVVLGCVMPYIHDPRDRAAVSLVCRRWYELDALTRKHITIALCYTTSPDRLRRRFKHLESLKLKGKPRAAMFNLIPEDWGGFVTPWVNEIAESFNCLKSLHFRRMIVTDSDLEVLAKSRGRVLQVFKLDNCSGFSTDGLLHVGRLCSCLEEFCGGSFNDVPDKYSAVTFPQKLCRLGLTYMGKNEMPIVFPFASLLKKLDLLYALLDTEDHCLLIEKCFNLEVLETRNVIGDRGLEVLASSCRRLKRLRIERGADEQGMEDEEALEHIGAHLRNLNDFRLVLLDREERITDLPLDNGVRSLLRQCEKLRRFALYLRPGGLTDVGLGYIGRYSINVRWMLLGYAGESDEGLLEFSKGCPSLQKLEMRGCCFTESALARAVMQLTSLRYLWVQGYRASSSNPGRDLSAMVRPFWNIELIPPRKVVVVNQVGEDVVVEQPAHVLAYYSLAGPRTDFPNSVVPLDLVGSSSLLTPAPPLSLADVPSLKLPALLPDPLLRLPMPGSQQIPTFTPLMCDPIVHIPVIDVCSSGQGYLVSAGPAISSTIPPLHPKLVNPLIPEPDSVVEKGARETLRLLISSSTQGNPQLMDVLPVVLTSADGKQGLHVTGSRGLYTGSSDVNAIANSMATIGLVSLSEGIARDGNTEVLGSCGHFNPVSGDGPSCLDGSCSDDDNTRHPIMKEGSS